MPKVASNNIRVLPEKMTSGTLSRKELKMPDSGGNGGVIINHLKEWLAALGVVMLTFWAWINKKLDGKVSRAEFSIHLKANEEAMKAQTKLCDANTRAIERIFDKLDGKEDKNRRP